MLLMVAVEGRCLTTNQTSAAFLGKRVTLESGGSDFADAIGTGSRDKNSRKIEAFKAHTRDDVFYCCRGDQLKWGEIDDYVDLMLNVSPLSLPPQATVDQVGRIMDNARLKLSESAGNQYLQSCLLLSIVKERGISVSEKEVLRAITNSVKKTKGKFRNEVLRASLRPEGYLYRRQVGYLLTKKYFDTVIKASIEVSPEEVAAEIAASQKEIQEAKDYNATLRPKIESIRADILSGKSDFIEAADKYSDCDSAIDDGVLGEFCYSSCPLHKNIRDFIFSSSTNLYSDVIETPYSYHVIKVLSRSYDKEDDEGEADGDDEEGSVSTNVIDHLASGIPAKVKIAHIMLEKREIDEELDEEAAMAIVRNRKAKAAMNEFLRSTYAKLSAEDGFKCDFKVNFRKRKKGKNEVK